MNRKKFSQWRFLILLLSCAISSSALAVEPTFLLKGTVSDAEGQALEGATVSIHETQVGVITNADGGYQFANVKAGTYHLHVQFLGFESVAKTVTVSGDLTVDFSLRSSSLEIKEVIVEGSYLKSPEEEQSLSLEVADEKYLLKSAGTGLLSSMDRLPGVNVLSLGTGVSKPVIRGLSNQRVFISDQGVKQEGQQWGSDHGLEIDQFGVGRVEVIKGPQSVLFGSDAMAGVIHIHPPAVPVRNSIRGEVRLMGQSNTEMLGGSIGLEGNSNGWFFRGRYSSKEFGDMRLPADSFEYNSFIFPIHDQQLQNTAGNERSWSATAGLTRSWGYSQITYSEFNQEIGFFSGAHGRPTTTSVASDGDSRDLDFPRQHIGHRKIIWNTNLQHGKNWLEVDLGYQLNDREELEALHGQGNGPVPESDVALKLELETISADLRYHHQLDSAFRLIYGLSARNQQNRRDGFDFLIPDFDFRQLGAFAFGEWRASEKWIWNSGLRVDWGDLSIKRFAEATYNQQGELDGEWERNPAIERDFSAVSAGLGTSFLPTHHFNLKLNLGASFRYPSAAELASNGEHHGAFRYEVGDPNLDSERGWQVDLGLNYHREKYLVKLSPFFNYFSNYIYLQPAARFSDFGGQLYQYTQAEAFLTGSELVIDYHLWKHLHLGFTGEVMVAENLESGLSLPLIPPARLMLDVEYSKTTETRLTSYYFLLTSEWVAAQNQVDRNENETPGYSAFHFSTGGSFRIGKQIIECYAQVQNLLNTEYFNHLSQYRPLNLPSPGRNLVLNLKIPIFSISKA